MVRHPHEMLSTAYVSERVFEKLSFYFLVAGELELILQAKMREEEKNARLHNLVALCYRKEYLEISDLREAYDAGVKEIEQERETWSDKIAEKHSFCEFRANLRTRERMEKTAALKVSSNTPLNTLVPRQAAPITPATLLDIKAQLDLANSVHVVFSAVCNTESFILFRKCNLVPQSKHGFDPNKQLKRSDIKVAAQYAQVAMRWPKADVTFEAN